MEANHSGEWTHPKPHKCGLQPCTKQQGGLHLNCSTMSLSWKKHDSCDGFFFFFYLQEGEIICLPCCHARLQIIPVCECARVCFPSIWGVGYRCSALSLSFFAEDKGRQCVGSCTCDTRKQIHTCSSRGDILMPWLRTRPSSAENHARWNEPLDLHCQHALYDQTSSFTSMSAHYRWVPETRPPSAEMDRQRGDPEAWHVS